MATPLLGSTNRVLFYPSDITLMEAPDIRRFLSDLDLNTVRNSESLWKEYAGRKELIDFDANNPGAGAKGGRRFGYDRESMTYYQEIRGGRRKVREEYIKKDVNRFALGIQALQRILMTQLMNKAITPQEWYDESTRLMKESYLASSNIARGTNEPMDEEERNYWLLLLLLLFLSFNNLVTAIATQEIPTNGKLRVYAGLRGSASRSVYENWRIFKAQQAGYKEARRILNIAEHCEETIERPGCIEEAARGWVPIESVVYIGGCTCRDNCKCSMQFRK